MPYIKISVQTGVVKFLVVITATNDNQQVGKVAIPTCNLPLTPNCNGPYSLNPTLPLRLYQAYRLYPRLLYGAGVTLGKAL